MKLVTIGRWRLSFCALFLSMSFHAHTLRAYEYVRSLVTYENVHYSYNLAKSVVTFYPSFSYNRVRYGNTYSVDVIMPRKPQGDQGSKPTVSRDDNGKVVAIDDGSQVAIVLGGIPYEEQHLDIIASLIKSEVFGISSFNLDFERRWSNWQWLREKRPNLSVRLYPTVDYTAPSHIDLIRFVIDLYERSVPVLAQCKAGKGRSATGIGAYLMVISFMAHDHVTVQEIEEYLQLLRPRVDFNLHHRQALQLLRNELLTYEDQSLSIMEKLKSKYQHAIAAREREIKEKFTTVWP